MFALFSFQLGAERAGQGADFLGDQEIALHEPLDRRRIAAVAIAHAPGDLGLQVEGQALFGPAGGEVQMAAHGPQKVEGAVEDDDLAVVEKAQLHELAAGRVRVQVLGDPEQGVEVAQRALAFFDIGLDQIAAGPGAGVAVIAFGQFGGDEFNARALDHLGLEAADEIAEQALVPGQAPRLQNRGADGHILVGEADALAHRARGVADLEAQIPQGIEHELDDALGVGGFLVGPQE